MEACIGTCTLTLPIELVSSQSYSTILGLEAGDGVDVVATSQYRHFVHMIDDTEDRVVFVDPGLIEKVEATAADGLDTVE